MNLQSGISFLLLFPIVIAFAIDVPLPSGFAEAVQNKGKSYRDTSILVTSDDDAVIQLGIIVEQFPPDNMYAREARILLARIHHPEVFAEFDNLITKWRRDERSPRPRGGRPGFLSGSIIAFTKQRPESKFVYVRDDTQETRLATTNRIILKGLHQKKIEKYTDAEVQAGIACNRAARQAVLEHFLKFFDEGEPYEQSEVVDAVYRLWGSPSYERRKDEPIADDLIESVYKDESRSLFVRYTASRMLPKERLGDIQGLMLNIVVKSMSVDFFQSEDLLNRALSNLESTADATALESLKRQTNGPKWKVAKVAEATRKIEARLSSRITDQ